MGKDIYTILADRLNEAGFEMSDAYEWHRSEVLLAAARVALNNEKASSFGISTRQICAFASGLKLEITELEVLLAILNEDTRYSVSVSLLASKYGRNRNEVSAVCSSLKRKGFVDYLDGTPFREGGYVTTIRGEMCLLSMKSMDELDTGAFIEKNMSGHGIPQPRTAVSRKSSLQKACDPFILLDPLDPSEEFFFEQPRENLDRPFLSILSEKIENFCNGRLKVQNLLNDIEQSMKYNRNKTMSESFRQSGYDSLTDWQKAVFLLLCNYFAKNGAVPMRISKKSSSEDIHSSLLSELINAVQALVTSGLVVMPPDETYSSNKDESAKDSYMLSPDVAGLVFHGMTNLINYGTLCKQADVWKCSSIEPRTLLFDEEMTQKVECLKTLVNPEISGTLMERLNEIGRKSLTCLFYGVPGVGKTELCRQLARSTGRDCIVVDPAKLNGSYWGDTEKNAREVFRAYKYLYKISDRAPILVFNEADGILTKRFTEVTRATEKSENAVQGIILQELETFEGIFVATTNLQNNLDAAADRRFLYKLRFDYPSPEIRSRIIRMKMNWITEEDATALANEFCLSGGQVDNVASKCIIEKFMTGNEASFEKMRGFCREEVSLRENKPRPASNIGFIRYPRNGGK